ncbi:hypothetical protein K438DRAFT_1992423 [Mycena galopus ATCC 62051]|nr:hypothetical protein K438DRAFT_1992423 [Mycena galopus ATCC 62051]
MPHHLQLDLHTHIHTYIHHSPPAMTTSMRTTATTASTPTEMEALVALVARLSTAALEASRLAVEVKAKIPAIVAAEVLAAKMSATAAAEAAAAEAAALSPLWQRGIPKTPAQLEALYPEGSGETWYVVIIGREPGMYRTAREADNVSNGVPNQLKQKKTSRRDAITWYREQYRGPATDEAYCVQKWFEVPAL